MCAEGRRLWVQMLVGARTIYVNQNIFEMIFEQENCA